MLAMKEASVETHGIHMELMDAMNQINIYSAEIAKELLKSGILTEGENMADTEESNRMKSDALAP
jgi:hypothetical protein